ncbi:MAG TPA: hypothetical protein VII93_14755 [Anaerolineales bacterium]
MNKLRDFLTYSVELSGRRKLRIYVKAALFIAVALLIALAIFLGQQYQTMQDMAAVATIHYEMSPTPPPGPTPTPEACPSDPGGWQFVDSGIPGDNLERIEPACVYDGLGRTIAWVLAIREGYSRAEASQALGFTLPPAQMKMSDIKVIDPIGNPLVASLVMVPLTAGYSEWYIDGKDLPAVYYFPQGCFRGIDTQIDVIGNKAQIWNGNYPVICYIVEDNAATHIIMSLGGHVFSASSSPTRSYLYFGYDLETKQWDWLGIDENLHSSTDVAIMSSDHKNYSGQYGGSVWSAQWLSQTYGLAMKALPDSWRTANDRAELQAILNSINSSNAP